MAADVGILDLLEKAQGATLKGDLAELARLAPMIEAFVEAGFPPDRAILCEIRKRADRNAVLLAATLKGVKAARRRMEAMAGPLAISTYNAKGQREGFAVPGPGATRRA